MPIDAKAHKRIAGLFEARLPDRVKALGKEKGRRLRKAQLAGAAHGSYVNESLYELCAQELETLHSLAWEDIKQVLHLLRIGPSDTLASDLKQELRKLLSGPYAQIGTLYEHWISLQREKPRSLESAMQDARNKIDAQIDLFADGLAVAGSRPDGLGPSIAQGESTSSVTQQEDTIHMTQIAQAWNAIRAGLQSSFSFYDIKEIVGLAGLDLTQISHLEQRAGGASKGQLMTGIDRIFAKLRDVERKRFLVIVAEEVLKRRPDTRDCLLGYLSRLGWTLVEDALMPTELMDESELAELPPEARHDLVKAAQRLRDGDLSGTISAACGAVDSATASVYAASGLGDPTKASFQERCNKALATRGVIPKMEIGLSELGWDTVDIKRFRDNFKGALNQGAYVIQALRSKMGDVHGTKPILKPLVFDSLRWAQLLVRALTDDQ